MNETNRSLLRIGLVAATVVAIVGGAVAAAGTQHQEVAARTSSIIPSATPSAPTPTPAPAIKVVPSSTNFTGAFPASCHSDGKHPDPAPACTPGSVRDTVTQATIATTICKSGWTATVRPPDTGRLPVITSGTEKLRAMRAYGVPVAQRSTTELDHFIPLELGGSNDASNLWAEPSDIPNAQFRNTKDHVENVLADAVCGRVKGHSVTLVQAQQAIIGDWTKALAKFALT